MPRACRLGPPRRSRGAGPPRLAPRRAAPARRGRGLPAASRRRSPPPITTRGWTCCSGPARSRPRSAANSPYVSPGMRPVFDMRLRAPATPAPILGSAAPFHRPTPDPGFIADLAMWLRDTGQRPIDTTYHRPAAPARPHLSAMPKLVRDAALPARAALSRTGSSASPIRSPARSASTIRRAPAMSERPWASGGYTSPARLAGSVAANNPRPRARDNLFVRYTMARTRRQPDQKPAHWATAAPKPRAIRRQATSALRPRRRASPASIMAIATERLGQP